MELTPIIEMLGKMGDGPFKTLILLCFIYGVRELSKMRKSVEALNLGMAVVVEKVHGHDKRISNLEKEEAMRDARVLLLNAQTVNAALTSSPEPIQQAYRMSAQIIVGAGTSLGTLQLQVSNDQAPAGNLATGFAPTNWSNLGTATAISAAGVTLIAPADMCYRWLQAVYSDTFVRINSITTVADVAGSLNSKYFLISSPTINYYVWMNVNSAGVDPLVPGKTGVEVALATGATANDVADAVAAALDALAAFVAPNPAANIVTCTNAASGASTAAADSVAAPTGFSFAFTQPTSAITVQVEVQSV